MKRILAGMLVVLGAFIGGVPVANAQNSDVNYDLWANVLRTYVNDDGNVNYSGLKKNRKDLDEFIENELENADITSFSSDEQKAFWINAYNALTMRLIINHYPLRWGGIRTINWGRPWSIKMNAAGRRLTLGEIEHEILRKWDPLDPRIHFAINCASIGCPELPNIPFYPKQLDAQLDREARNFMNDPEKIRLDRTDNTLHHSAILNWFQEDFLKEYKDVITFVGKYLNEKDNRYLQAHKGRIKLEEMKYDWSLNEQK